MRNIIIEVLFVLHFPLLFVLSPLFLQSKDLAVFLLSYQLLTRTFVYLDWISAELSKEQISRLLWAVFPSSPGALVVSDRPFLSRRQRIAVVASVLLWGHRAIVVSEEMDLDWQQVLVLLPVQEWPPVLEC